VDSFRDRESKTSDLPDTVPTIRFQVLYVFLVLAHDRRRVVHFNVTAHPTTEWTAQQLREAFPFDQIPRYLLRDRDKIFGATFREQVKGMKIKEVLSAPRSPWQRAYVERVIGSIRRECLDHVIVFGESSLRRILYSYFSYMHTLHSPKNCLLRIRVMSDKKRCRSQPMLCHERVLSLGPAVASWL
jgi:transposase InsO family protein